jgi:hypothetical protein
VACEDAITGSLRYSYHALVFGDGSVWAAGSISDSASQAAGNASHAPGADALAPVTIVFDTTGPANGGRWTIAVNRASLQAALTYNDVDIAGNETSWSLGGCTAVDH